jgi:hypothetical protein
MPSWAPKAGTDANTVAPRRLPRQSIDSIQSAVTNEAANQQRSFAVLRMLAVVRRE